MKRYKANVINIAQPLTSGVFYRLLTFFMDSEVHIGKSCIFVKRQWVITPAKIHRSPLPTRRRKDRDTENDIQNGLRMKNEMTMKEKRFSFLPTRMKKVKDNEFEIK